MKSLRFLGIILVVFMTSCTTRYIPQNQVRSRKISLKLSRISYTVLKTPTVAEPDMEVKFSKVNIFKVEKRRLYRVKKSPNSLAYLLELSMVGAGVYYYKKGYVALGEDLGIGAAIFFAGGQIMSSFSHKTWRSEGIGEAEERVPLSNIDIAVEGNGVRNVYRTTKDGMLNLDLADLQLFYREGSDLITLSFKEPEGQLIGKVDLDVSELKDKLERPKVPPDLYITEVEFKEVGGNGNLVLDAEEHGKVNVSVTNKGKGFGKELLVTITPDKDIPGFSYEKKKVIPKLMPGDTVNLSFSIWTTKKLPTTRLTLTINVREPYFGADAVPKLLTIETHKFEPPNLVLLRKGAKEGEISKKALSTLLFIVSNTGTGVAKDVRVKVNLPPDSKWVFLAGDNVLNEKESKWFSIGEMAPSDWAKISVPIYVSPRYKSDSISVQLVIKEEREEFSRNYAVSFPLNSYMPPPDTIVVVGRRRSFGVAEAPPVIPTVDSKVPVSKIRRKNLLGVVIGAENYLYTKRVKFAEEDARAMKKYLIRVLGADENNVIELDNPSLSTLREWFGDEASPGRIKDLVNERKISMLIVYYSGHGIPFNDKPYILPVDANPLGKIDLNSYSLETLYKNLSQLPVDTIVVFLDACFSGLSFEGPLGEEISGVAPFPTALPSGGRLTVFTAAKKDQVASWFTEASHGFFTYYLLRGLRGDADANRDGVVTTGELATFVSDSVSIGVARKFHNKGLMQNPDFHGNPNIVLAKYKH